ncbi:MAG TPA: serine hydrolase [Cyclobacteriaceae bacterium]|nr:serine hydrolase [Cyclobacteriaceae bacterium]
MTTSKLISLLSISLCLSVNTVAQVKTDSLLKKILWGTDHKILNHVLQHKDSFRVQIIYTQINRDKNNRPAFQNYYFNVDSNLYFNPASTVKLPLALLALEKLNSLNLKGVNKYTALQIDSSATWQTPDHTDSTAQNNLPSIAHYIKRALLISENDPYNRLYQFVGQQTINRNLHAKGYRSTRITRQFLGLSDDQNRHTNAMRFIRPTGELIYEQPPAYNTDPFYFDKVVKIGNAHYKSGKLINEPIDFTRVNNLPLEDLQRILQSALFPNSVPAVQRFKLTEDDSKFLYQYLSQYPSETNYPKYDTSEYYDSYVKFYFRNESHQMPSYVRVFNKVGWAYGFLIDASYIVDFKNQVEFMLTATAYVNRDGVLNDDKYEYETIGWPFMYQLGQTVYQYELTRQRKYKPDLSLFRIDYGKRDVHDTRPVIKTADN